MTTYANIETKSAPLAYEFGREYATRLFGEEALKDLPRYVRGPKKGELKGVLVWSKVVSGGWDRSLGGVVYPGQVVSAFIADNKYASQNEALRGMWLGRIQALSSYGAYLGERGRAQWEMEDASRKAAEEEIRNEILNIQKSRVEACEALLLEQPDNEFVKGLLEIALEEISKIEG